VAVEEEHRLGGGGRGEQEGLVDTDAGEDALEAVGVVFPVFVVVAPDLDVAGPGGVRVMETAEEVVDGGVGDVGLVEVFYLPELLGVAQFDVGVALPPVVLEGAFVQEGVVGEFVAGGAVAAVAVAHDDETGRGHRRHRRKK